MVVSLNKKIIDIVNKYLKPSLNIKDFNIISIFLKLGN